MRVTIKEAATRLGIPEQCLRVGLQQDKFPFGHAIKTSENRYTYYIHRGRLYEYIGELKNEKTSRSED